MPMVKTTENLTIFERDLVNGFYRLHAAGCYIPKVVKKLSMAYLWILDEFRHSDPKPKLCPSISGLNRTILECNTTIGVTVFGKNLICSKKSTFHHWRFRLRECPRTNFPVDTPPSNSNSNTATHNEFNFIVGIRATDAVNMYGLIGSHGLKIHPTESMMIPFTTHRFNEEGDILDMHLDLSRGQLSYILNNESLGVAYDGLDLSKEYRMQCAVSNKHSSLELIAFHSSPSHAVSSFHSEKIATDYLQYHFYDLLQYIRSLPSHSHIDEKVTLLKAVLDYYGADLYEVTNDYIDCLLIKQDYDSIHNLFSSNSLSTISRPQRLCQMASYFYFEAADFVKALDVFRWIIQYANGSNGSDAEDRRNSDCDRLSHLKGEEILIRNHLIVECGFCHEHHGEYETALRLYSLALKHDTLLPPSGRSEVLHHIAGESVTVPHSTYVLCSFVCFNLIWKFEIQLK